MCSFMLLPMLLTPLFTMFWPSVTSSPTHARTTPLFRSPFPRHVVVEELASWDLF
ncbi:hypothetical protein AAZX31_03G057800 [Glycine max]|uniref:Uncharacterized protein n=2 Tax=Glycine subgen. Soja TaxID=1462606 RepID=A0A0R0KKZ1_SOYBN|nr:hypothetical protein GLYMA_03G068300v4 [Glycine max]RZC19436.1 hypothetical protein D0Y65_006314 [Glycine soja]KAG5054254.1 hypothetical protein JHK85_006764 [Glycine max]KAG5071357.1 hypothetical protein JHK86_006568 [Glycine max]KAH1068866.1 hypothetical protein GYH30_006440 [Glycine max]